MKSSSLEDKELKIELKEMKADDIDAENLKELMQNQIKCFQHCLRTERFLCFEMPDKCPTCSTYLDSKLMPTKFRVPPFVLPPPLTVTNTRSAPYLPPFSLLLQPTDGDYLKIIQSNKSNHPSQMCRHHHQRHHEPDIGDLHIGITNSKSEIFDFDSNGLNHNADKWFTIPSIVIKLEQQINLTQQHQHFKEMMSPPSSNRAPQLNIFLDGQKEEKYKQLIIRNYTDKWDLVLHNFWQQRHAAWKATKYDEFELNCLDFIINVLLDYGFFDLNDDLEAYFENMNGTNCHVNKSEFIQEKQNLLMKNLLKQKLSRELIEPEFIKCLKYLNLLIKLHKQKYFVERIISKIDVSDK